MVYTAIAVVLFITDGIIKYFVEKKGRAGDNLPAFHGKIILRKYHNRGAMLDIYAQNQPLVAMVSLLFTIFMTGVYVATLGRKGKKLLKTGLALILGGAYSNTYDRLKRKYVVDYVSFPVKNQKIRNVVFNISDFGIIIGSVFLVLSA